MKYLLKTVCVFNVHNANNFLIFYLIIHEESCINDCGNNFLLKCLCYFSHFLLFFIRITDSVKCSEHDGFTGFIIDLSIEFSTEVFCTVFWQNSSFPGLLNFCHITNS